MRGAAARFAEYRSTIGAASECLEQLGLRRKPEKEEKQLLLQVCRNRLCGHALDAFDTAVLLTGDSAKFPPLVGTGWNDGRLEFTTNFMQRVVAVLDPGSVSDTPFAKDSTFQAVVAKKKNLQQVAPACRRVLESRPLGSDRKKTY